jgi:hypothetical protein
MDPITHRERTRPTRDSIKASLNRLHVFFEDLMPDSRTERSFCDTHVSRSDWIRVEALLVQPVQRIPIEIFPRTTLVMQRQPPQHQNGVIDFFCDRSPCEHISCPTCCCRDFANDAPPNGGQSATAPPIQCRGNGALGAVTARLVWQLASHEPSVA